MIDLNIPEKEELDGLCDGFLSLLVECFPGEEDDWGYGFVQVDVGCVFEHFIDDKERYGCISDIDEKWFDKGSKFLLEVFHYLIQLFFVRLFDEHLVHVDNHL